MTLAAETPHLPCNIIARIAGFRSFAHDGAHPLARLTRPARLLHLWTLPPDDTPVRSLCSRIVCTQCGMIGADVRPHWGPHVNKRRV